MLQLGTHVAVSQARLPPGRHGVGVDYGRGIYVMQLRTGAKAWIVYDAAIGGSGSAGTTTSRIGYAATIAAAKAAWTPANGDWILLPAGGSTTTQPGSINNTSGYSKQYPFLWGTYDPADRTNEARWNLPELGAFTFNITAPSGDLIPCFGTGDYQAFTCLKFKIPETGAVAAINLLGARKSPLVQACLFDTAWLLMQGNIFDDGSTLGAISSRADSVMMTDHSVVSCGFGYCTSYNNSAQGGVYWNAGRRGLAYGNVGMKAGWTRTATRSTVYTAGGPGQRAHLFYIDGYNDGSTLRDNISIKDSSNAKITGGGIVNTGYFFLKCPIGAIYRADADGALLWPSSSTVKEQDATFFKIDDISTDPGNTLPRGTMSWFMDSASGSWCRGAFGVRGDTNPTSVNRECVTPGRAAVYPRASTPVTALFAASFGNQDLAMTNLPVTGSVIPNASPGATNLTATSGAHAAGMAASNALTSFDLRTRIKLLSDNVAAAGTEDLMDDAMGDWMWQRPWATRWANRFAGVVRAPAGR